MKTPEQNKQDQQKCKNCGRIVGCDYNGRKHKCDCGKMGMEMNVKEKAEKIYQHQKEIDRLLGEIYEDDEQYGESVCEVLREELYK